jgi:TP901 family phage tail tape measure protein
MSFNLGSAHGEIVIDYNGAGVQQAMGDLNTLSQQGTNLLRAGAGVGAFGAAIGGALLGATNQAADFQFQMDAVNAALGGLDASGMEAVTQQALDLGAATKFSAGEVAGVQEQLAKSGLSSEQILGGATQAVLDLSAATGEQLQPATVATAAALNLFNIDAAHTADVADIFTAGLNESSATLSDFQRGINNLGPVMANLNQYANDGEGAFRDTAAAVAYFNAQGLKAADAGVSLARGLTNLANPTSKASDLMQELGINAFDAQGNFIGFPDLMDQLNKSHERHERPGSRGGAGHHLRSRGRRRNEPSRQEGRPGAA